MTHRRPERADRRARRLAAALLLAATGAGPDAPARADAVAAGGAATPMLPAVRVDPPLRSLTVAGVGDVLPEELLLDAGRRGAVTSGAGSSSAFDFAPVFAPVAPIIGWADLAICHIETPLGTPGQRPGVYGRSAFGGNLLLAPYELADGLHDTGFDRCSTASNHANDLGSAGIATTLAALDDAAIGHAGTSRSPSEAAVSVVTVAGIRVAHLSYSRYSNTAWPSTWWALADGRDVARVAADVAAARAAGAEVVIVSMHISQELLPAPIAADRVYVEQLTAAAHIDLIIEHGPHVVQPMETVNGTVVFWSVGNFDSGMGPPKVGRYADPRTTDGLIATARISETSPGTFVTTGVPIAVCVDRETRTVYAPSLSLDDPSLSAATRAGLEACLARTRQVVPDAV